MTVNSTFKPYNFHSISRWLTTPSNSPNKSLMFAFFNFYFKHRIAYFYTPINRVITRYTEGL